MAPNSGGCLHGHARRLTQSNYKIRIRVSPRRFACTRTNRKSRRKGPHYIVRYLSLLSHWHIHRSRSTRQLAIRKKIWRQEGLLILSPDHWCWLAEHLRHLEWRRSKNPLGVPMFSERRHRQFHWGFTQQSSIIKDPEKKCTWGLLGTRTRISSPLGLGIWIGFRKPHEFLRLRTVLMDHIPPTISP